MQSKRIGAEIARKERVNRKERRSTVETRSED